MGKIIEYIKEVQIKSNKGTVEGIGFECDCGNSEMLYHYNWLESNTFEAAKEEIKGEVFICKCCDRSIQA